MAETKKLNKAQRRAARLAPGAPQRVCKTPDCSTILSKFNDDDICNHCYEAVPLNERPYKHRSF